MSEIEKIRGSFRPAQTTVLFIGESAPSSGKFFYCANTKLFREMKKALDGDEEFLGKFKDRGYYLDDLVSYPINQFTKAREKRPHYDASVEPLAGRIAVEKPTSAIIIVGLGISNWVRKAAHIAQFTGSIYDVPFPGRPEHTQRFQTTMAANKGSVR